MENLLQVGSIKLLPLQELLGNWISPPDCKFLLGSPTLSSNMAKLKDGGILLIFLAMLSTLIQTTSCHRKFRILTDHCQL